MDAARATIDLVGPLVSLSRLTGFAKCQAGKPDLLKSYFTGSSTPIDLVASMKSDTKPMKMNTPAQVRKIAS
jgi:hypothetical protein